MHNKITGENEMLAGFDHIFMEKNQVCNTFIEGVQSFFFDKPHSKQNCFYEASIVILCEGYKEGHLHGKRFSYDEDHFMVIGAPTSLLCQSFASKETPVKGFLIDIDKKILQEIASQIKLEHKKTVTTLPETSVIQTAKLCSHMKTSLQKMLEILSDEEKSHVFGKDILKELYYYVLKNEHIYVLDSLIDYNSQFTRIMKVLEHMSKHIDQPVHIEDLSKLAGMSVPTFHRIFKKITDDSPIQFIKKVRLSKAKYLIENQGIKVNQASIMVGYESASQFSREFKRLYGITPKAVA